MRNSSEAASLPAGSAERRASASEVVQDADPGDFSGDLLLQPPLSFQSQPPLLPRTSQRLVIGLIDHYCFSQECLLRALQDLNPDDIVVRFAMVQDCIAAGRSDFDLIIYYPHEHDTAQSTTLSNVTTIHSAYPTVQLVVLSDADDMHQSVAKRKILESGANAFVPTRTSSVFITIGAIRFLKEGGTIAPPQSPASARRSGAAHVERHRRLTPREIAVLAHLQRGKANKIIAHALGLSENTIKIHIRNIMRKMGATNRTQAVDAARSLWSDAERQSATDAVLSANLVQAEERG